MDLTHDQLVTIAGRWLTSNGCGFSFTEMGVPDYTKENPDALGFAAADLSVLIECKLSRSDFLSDKNKPFRKNPEQGVGDFRYYMAPRGLINLEELPDKWGLLEVDKSGRVFKRKAVGFHRAGTLGHRTVAQILSNPVQLHGYLKSAYAEGFRQILADRHPKNIRAEQGFMWCALRRLHIKQCLPILKAGISDSIKWEVV